VFPLSELRDDFARFSPPLCQTKDLHYNVSANPLSLEALIKFVNTVFPSKTPQLPPPRRAQGKALLISLILNFTLRLFFLSAPLFFFLTGNRFLPHLLVASEKLV